MRRILYGLILATLFFAPVTKLDIAKLEPIQSVAITQRQGKITLITDTERKGRGSTVSEALEDLRSNTPAVVYLDTAEYLLVANNAQSLVDEMLIYLKSDVKVAPYGGTDIKEETKYLESHSAPPKKAGRTSLKNMKKLEIIS